MDPTGFLDRKRFEELKSVYVLGALTEEEQQEFEKHLAAYPARRAEVDELAAVAGLIALYPEERDPPADLRRRIMSLVDTEATTPHARGTSGFAKLWELLRPQNLALGAAALLVIGLFSWSMLLRGETQDLRSQVQEMQASQDAQTIELEGTGTLQVAQAQLVTLEDNRAVLMAEDMPPLPEGKTYQIWVIEDEAPKPSGLFKAAEGPVATVVETPLKGADAVAVTIEPEGGSPRPTSDPMLVAEDVRG